MLTIAKKKISFIKLSQILLKIQKGNDLEPIYSELSAAEMKELRNFLEEEILYLSSFRDESTIELSNIKSKYIPAPEYYHNQDCHEPLESCINETCYISNPKCFSRKMKTHIEMLEKLLAPYLKKQ